MGIVIGRKIGAGLGRAAYGSGLVHRIHAALLQNGFSTLSLPDFIKAINDIKDFNDATFDLYPIFTTFLVPASKSGNVAFVSINPADENDISIIPTNFTRANTPEDGTKSGSVLIDANGDFVELVANQPRWTYKAGGQVNAFQRRFLSFLPEDEELLVHTKDFNQPNWATNDFTATYNVADPFGGNTAVRLETTGGGNNAFQQVYTGTIGVDYAGGFWVRGVADYEGNILLRIADVGNFISIDVTDEWQFFQYTGAPTTTTVRLAVVVGVSTGVIIEVAMPKLRVGTSVIESAVDFIPTDNLTLTRQQDVAADLGDLQGSGFLSSTNEGAVIFQVSNSGTDPIATRNHVSARNAASASQWAFVSSSLGYRLFDYINSAYFTWNGLSYLPENELAKIVVIWSASGLRVWYNGFLVYSSVASTFDVTQITGLRGYEGMSFGYKQIAFDPIPPTATEAEKASSWATLEEMAEDLNYTIE